MSFLSNHLTVDKDLRLNPKPHEGGRISEFFFIFRSNMNNMLIQNLMFMIFIIPLVCVVYFISSAQITELNMQFNFMGNVGIGYPGASDDSLRGLMALYDSYLFIVWLLIPCIAFIGIGASGYFYCLRNFMWSADMRGRFFNVKYFLRGIKLYWWKYLIVMTVFSGLTALFGYVVITFLKMMALQTLSAGIITALVFACLMMLLAIEMLIYILPMIVHYKFGLFSILKNSFLLSIRSGYLTIPILVLMALPVVLAILVPFLAIVVLFLMLTLGFSLYALMITAFGQFNYERYIQPEYEIRQKLGKSKSRVKQKKQKPVHSDNGQEKQKSQKTKPQAYTNPKKKKKK